MKACRIGYDIDGVLADFRPALDKRAMAMFGKIDTDTRLKAEASILDTEERDFWLRLRPTKMNRFVELMLNAYGDYRYFITRRPPCTQAVTKAWLAKTVGFNDSDILVSGAVEKGAVVAGLYLDAYFDDDPIHCIQVSKMSEKTEAYLVTTPHNEWFNVDEWNNTHAPEQRIIRLC